MRRFGGFLESGSPGMVLSSDTPPGTDGLCQRRNKRGESRKRTRPFVCVSQCARLAERLRERSCCECWGPSGIESGRPGLKSIIIRRAGVWPGCGRGGVHLQTPLTLAPPAFRRLTLLGIGSSRWHWHSRLHPLRRTAHLYPGHQRHFGVHRLNCCEFASLRVCEDVPSEGRWWVESSHQRCQRRSKQRKPCTYQHLPALPGQSPTLPASRCSCPPGLLTPHRWTSPLPTPHCCPHAGRWK